MKAQSKKTQAAQVYFPVDLYWEIKVVAQKKGLSLAAWLRDVAQKELHEEKTRQKSLCDLPTFSLSNVDPHLSEHLDDVIYGEKS